MTIFDIPEGYVSGRSVERAIEALAQIVAMGETETVIDMYERAAWLSGATVKQTRDAIREARKGVK